MNFPFLLPFQIWCIHPAGVLQGSCQYSYLQFWISVPVSSLLDQQRWPWILTPIHRINLYRKINIDKESRMNNILVYVFSKIHQQSRISRIEHWKWQMPECSSTFSYFITGFILSRYCNAMPICANIEMGQVTVHSVCLFASYSISLQSNPTELLGSSPESISMIAWEFMYELIVFYMQRIACSKSKYFSWVVYQNCKSALITPCAMKYELLLCRRRQGVAATLFVSLAYATSVRFACMWYDPNSKTSVWLYVLLWDKLLVAFGSLMSFSFALQFMFETSEILRHYVGNEWQCRHTDNIMWSIWAEIGLQSARTSHYCFHNRSLRRILSHRRSSQIAMFHSWRRKRNSKKIC